MQLLSVPGRYGYNCRFLTARKVSKVVVDGTAIRQYLCSICSKNIYLLKYLWLEEMGLVLQTS